jgi:hypothetical protein
VSQPLSLKVATFNVWHGLAGRGVKRFREFESRERREDRFRETLRLLSDLDPQILLLQELNPVSTRGSQFRQVLGGFFTGRVDQSGLKFFSHGFPENLATGLGLLIRGDVRDAREREDVYKIPAYVRLSGSVGFSGEAMSLHVDEQRYAQLKSVRHKKLGRLLIVNTHLHHGFERFPPLMDLLSAAVATGKVSEQQHDDLFISLDRAEARRLHEMDRILEVVHMAESSHDGILIGGDLNSTSSGAAYKAFILDGYRDFSSDSEYTWDPVTNFENHRIQRDEGFDFPLPDFGNPELVKIYRAFDELPRRIDFLLGKGSLSTPAAVSRFGFPNKETGLAASDHYGVMATFE